jgi:hypothetical protein
MNRERTLIIIFAVICFGFQPVVAQSTNDCYSKHSLSGRFLSEQKVGPNSNSLKNAVGLSFNYLYQPMRWLALEAGLEWVPRPVGSINYGSYSINANDELYLAPFGARYVFEPEGSRMRLSAGGGGAYLNHTIGQQALWLTPGLSGWGGQFVASGDYGVTRSGRFRLGFTMRYFLGTVRYTYPNFSTPVTSHILTIGPEFIFRFR